MPVCCRCNASRRCRNCSCKKSAQRCVNCLPYRHVHCENAPVGHPEDHSSSDNSSFNPQPTEAEWISVQQVTFLISAPLISPSSPSPPSSSPSSSSHLHHHHRHHYCQPGSTHMKLSTVYWTTPHYQVPTLCGETWMEYLSLMPSTMPTRK